MINRMLATFILMSLTTSAHADQLVRAAWYGNELRGHRTASGVWLSAIQEPEKPFRFE